MQPYSSHEPPPINPAGSSNTPVNKPVEEKQPSNLTSSANLVQNCILKRLAELHHWHYPKEKMSPVVSAPSPTPKEIPEQTKSSNKLKTMLEQAKSYLKGEWKSATTQIRQKFNDIKEAEGSYLSTLDLSSYQLGDPYVESLIQSADRVYQKIDHHLNHPQGSKKQQSEALKKDLGWTNYKIDQLSQRLKSEEPLTSDAGQLLEKLLTMYAQLKQSLESKIQESSPSLQNKEVQAPQAEAPPINREALRQEFDQLVQHARQLDNEGLAETHKITFKSGKFELTERQMGLQHRRGTSSGAERTLREVIRVIREGWETKTLTPQDVNHIENLRLRLEKEDQIAPTLSYHPELKEEFQRVFDKIRVETSLAPIIADNEKMVNVFENPQVKQAQSRLFNFLGKQVLTNSDGEHFTQSKTQEAIETLSATVTDYQNFIAGQTSEVPESGLGATKAVKGFTKELLKQAAEKLDSQYKTSNSPVAQQWKKLQSAFDANAKLVGAVPLNWQEIETAILWMSSQVPG